MLPDATLPARWNPDDLGLAVARLAVALLVSAGEPVTVAIDDTLFRRRGRRSDQPTPEEIERHPPGLGRARGISAKVELLTKRS